MTTSRSTRPIAPPVIETHAGFEIVRDDLVPGGTKTRCLPVLFQRDRHEYVYASPVYGYAQIALAYAARAHGHRATVFCAKRYYRHPRTVEAAAAGATVHEVAPGYLTVVRARALSYCSVSGAVLLPFGLDDPRFVTALAGVALALPIRPRQVWSVAGSGVLTRALQLAWPDAEVHAVLVGKEANCGRAITHRAPEKFEDDAVIPAPFPSCSNYDAKAWRFVRAHARPGALFWNVAG